MSERMSAFSCCCSRQAASLSVGTSRPRSPMNRSARGPFPLLVFALLGICSLGLVLSKRPATTVGTVAGAAAGGRHVRRGAGLCAAVRQARLRDLDRSLGIPLSRYFGGTWKQSLLAGAGLGVILFLLFDKLLDVALPIGFWLKATTGVKPWKSSLILSTASPSPGRSPTS